MKYIKTFEKLRLVTQKDLNENLLNYSKSKKSLQLIRDLIERGANVNCRDGRKRTPLIIASSVGFYSGIRLLIENGANVNAVDDDGNTALIFIGSKYNIGPAMKSTIDLFIQNGVDLNHTNERGIDAFHSLTNSNLEKYIQEKYPDLYDEYLMKKDANKYNL